MKSSSVSTEVELHSAPPVALEQPTSEPAVLFAVSVADQMAVLADALGVPELYTQALLGGPLARSRTR